MRYQVIKVYNNNILLAENKGEEAILVSKGIGFGKIKGDVIEENTPIEKIFHETASVLSLQPRKKEKEERELLIAEIIKEIITVAQKRLGKLNQNLEKALQDHIEFALDRIELGMSIQNPFIDEIISLYPKEYEVAKAASELIEETFNIRLGEEEEGFITLHLCSATGNKTLPEVMNVTRVYKGCIQIIEKEYDVKVNLRKTESKAFLKNLKLLEKSIQTQKKLSFPQKDYFKKFLYKSYHTADLMSKYLYEEKKIQLTEDAVLFLAIEIEKIVQFMQ